VTAGSTRPGDQVAFLLTDVVANRLLIPVLRSRLGRRIGHRLGVVEDGAVRIGVGSSECTTWWRNSSSGHPLRLRLAGKDYDTTAHVVRDRDGVSVVAELQVP